MKRILSILLALIMVFAVCGCKKEDAEIEDGDLEGGQVLEGDIGVDYFQSPDYEVISKYQNFTIATPRKYVEQRDALGNLVVEIECQNGDEIGYEIQLTDVNVNGYNLNSYQSVMVPSKNSVGYSLPVLTSALEKFGQKRVDEITFKIKCYMYNEETYERGQLMFTSGNYTVLVSGQAYMDKSLGSDSFIYDENNIKISIETADTETNTNVYVYAENHNEEPLTLSFNPVVINGEEKDIQGVEYVYETRVADNGKGTALMPLSNYSYDEKENKLVKEEINSLQLTANITLGEKTYTKVLTVK